MHVPSDVRPIALIALIALVGLIGLAACSRDESVESDRTKAPITPALSSQDAQAPASVPRAAPLSATLTAAGIPTSYQASFLDRELTRIDESRSRDGAAEIGAYEFQGARLLKYEGGAITSKAAVQLELDMQGRVTKALANGAPASEEEINALRARAQLLRSHALAQRATQMHQPPQG